MTSLAYQGIPYNQVIQDMRDVFNSGKTKSVSWRKSQLEAAVRLLTDNEEKLIQSLYVDLGKDRYDALIDEIHFCKNELEWFIFNIEDLMQDKKVNLSLLNVGGKAYLHYEPFGVILNIGAWNYPVQLAFSPLASIIAAGNCLVFKPSELSPNTSKLLAELFPRYFDEECIKVVEGGIPETTALLTQRWDHIMYTGNSVVGKIVYKAAAEYLTPCTLELGGKCPTYVDKGSDMEACANRIAWTKFKNAGQTCLTNDYVLVHQSVMNEFVAALTLAVRDMYGENPEMSHDYTKIVNRRHFRRICDLLDSCGGKRIELGGDREEGKLYIAPTILTGVTFEDKMMQEEIFGPLLPVLPVKDHNEAIDIVNNREKPLHLYVFSKSDRVIDDFVARTSSGGVTVNDCLLAAPEREMPFGGVGDSGFGYYHGRPGFINFSHAKPVLVKSQAMEFLFKWMRYAPHNETKFKRLTWLTKASQPSKFMKTLKWFALVFLLVILAGAAIFLGLAADTRGKIAGYIPKVEL